MSEVILEAAPLLDLTLYVGTEHIDFHGAAKVNGSLYFLSSKIVLAKEGGARSAIFSNRIETMTGCSASGKSRVKLEELMDFAHATALEWAAKNWRPALENPKVE